MHGTATFNMQDVYLLHSQALRYTARMQRGSARCRAAPGRRRTALGWRSASGPRRAAARATRRRAPPGSLRPRTRWPGRARTAAQPLRLCRSGRTAPRRPPAPAHTQSTLGAGGQRRDSGRLAYAAAPYLVGLREEGLGGQQQQRGRRASRAGAAGAARQVLAAKAIRALAAGPSEADDVLLRMLRAGRACGNAAGLQRTGRPHLWRVPRAVALARKAEGGERPGDGRVAGLVAVEALNYQAVVHLRTAHWLGSVRTIAPLYHQPAVLRQSTEKTVPPACFISV
jgi:hypothetical protein